MAEAARPKAKPAAPEAMPPMNPPTHRTMRVVTESEAKISDHIEEEHEPDRKTRGETNRNGDTGALAHRQELNRELAQPQRHVQRQRHDDAAFGEFDERRVGHLEEFVED